MFEVGWSEILVIMIVVIVVVGPKDLPKMLRAFGKATAKMRSVAGEFQRQFDAALKEAELDDLKKSIDTLRSMNPTNEIKKHLSPFEQAASDVRAGLQSAVPPKSTPVNGQNVAAAPEASVPTSVAATHDGQPSDAEINVATTQPVASAKDQTESPK